MVEVNVEASTGTGLRLTCDRDELVRQLSVVSRALSMRSTVQILSGILLEATTDRLELAATDMELSLQVGLDSQVDETGKVVVPGRLLVELARLLPQSDVAISHRPEEGVVEVICGAAEYKLHTYGAEDFPRLPDPSAAALFTVDRAALVETAMKVSRSASRDESRPVLTGILVRFEPGKLVMAATDAYRLSVKETPLEAEAPELEAIVPARALAELGRVAQGDGELQLGVHENQVVFTVDGAVLTTRRIDGQFPNYSQLFPETFEHELAIARDELLDVVRRTAVMSQRNSPLRLHFGEGELTVSVQTQELGEAKETMPVPFSGEPIEIGFNPDFLREGIESVEEDELHLKLISPLRPAVIEVAEERFSYLIMPIRLPG
jgi:DNA polymerase III subunit beta